MRGFAALLKMALVRPRKEMLRKIYILAYNEQGWGEITTLLSICTQEVATLDAKRNMMP